MRIVISIWSAPRVIFPATISVAVKSILILLIVVILHTVAILLCTGNLQYDISIKTLLLYKKMLVVSAAAWLARKPISKIVKWNYVGYKKFKFQKIAIQ